MVVGSIASSAAANTGFVAAAIAVTGFVFHVTPVLSHAPEEAIRRATVIGGLAGIIWSVGVILLSAFLD